MQDKTTKDRIKSLQKHLAEENPLLVSVVEKFVELDRIGLSLGVLNSRDSYTTEISWWPLISILGTFSAANHGQRAVRVYWTGLQDRHDPNPVDH